MVSLYSRVVTTYEWYGVQLRKEISQIDSLIENQKVHIGKI